MKKIFYFIASAIVALGAMACQNEIDDNINPNTQSEGLSFTATINQDTKVSWDDLIPSWKDGDEVIIDKYTFTYNEQTAQFTCTDENVMDLVDGNPKTATHGTFNSNNGVEGTVFTATGEIKAKNTVLEFSPANALLKFIAPKDNTILTGDGLFSTGNTFTVTASGEVQYVAINATTATFSYSVNSTEVKKIESKEFVAGKIYNLGELSAYTVYVTAQPNSNAADWETINLYAWNANENNNWPGANITANSKEINGYTYYYFTFPASFNNTEVSVIVNNGSGAQTTDIELGTLDKDYYVVYSTVYQEVVTEAPAAGSIKEAETVIVDPKPETTTIYLQTSWSWANWALWGWTTDNGDQNWFTKSWPGETTFEEVVIGENTYKAWDVPSTVDKTKTNTIIISGEEWSQRKQTANCEVDITKDVFVEIYWDSTASQAKLRTIASPYTE